MFHVHLEAVTAVVEELLKRGISVQPQGEGGWLVQLAPTADLDETEGDGNEEGRPLPGQLSRSW